MTPCSLAYGYQCFRATCYFHILLADWLLSFLFDTEDEGFFWEILVSSYLSIRSHTPEDGNTLHCHCYKNLKSKRVCVSDGDLTFRLFRRFFNMEYIIWNTLQENISDSYGVFAIIISNSSLFRSSHLPSTLALSFPSSLLLKRTGVCNWSLTEHTIVIRLLFFPFLMEIHNSLTINYRSLYVINKQDIRT
jgi:hypothetical protein